MPASIRFATEEDAAGVQAIYAPVVRDTPISFEFEPPSVAEIASRIRKILEHWPWLVCEKDGHILGYAYASEHRTRAAYQWSADATVYIHPEYRRCSVGRALYSALFPLLNLQGYRSVFAGVTLPNAGSVGLHEAMGFRPIGTFRRVGFKQGRWHDVGWWQLELNASDAAPQPTIAASALDLREVASILEAARNQLAEHLIAADSELRVRQ